MRDPRTYQEFVLEESRRVSHEWLQRFIQRWYGADLARPKTIGQHDGAVWEIHLQMRCERPYSVWYRAHARRDGSAHTALVANALYRCRKCSECLRSKGMRWAARAVDEYHRSARTWAGALTMAPHHHAMMDAQLAQHGLWPDRSRLSEDDYAKALFRARAGQFGQRVSLWLDLLRRIAVMRGAPAGGKEMRYLLVAEAHNEQSGTEVAGRPHMHILLHEVAGGYLVRGTAKGGDNEEIVDRKYQDKSKEWKRGLFVSDDALIRKTWELGHNKFQLCIDEKAAFYLCKYMSKDMRSSRVRASLNYGASVEPEAADAKNTGGEPVRIDYDNLSGKLDAPPEGDRLLPLPSGEGLGVG